MNDELNDRLNSWGKTSTPPVDGAFANRLEADLRVSTAPAAKRPGFGWLLRPGVLVAAAVAIVGGIFVANIDSSPQLQMTAAQGTTVSVPGVADLQNGVAGLVLPDGTRIDVGPDGSAIVAGVVLEAGSSAEVVNGRLEITDTGLPNESPSDNPVPPATTSGPPETTPSATRVPPTVTPTPDTSTRPPQTSRPPSTTRVAPPVSTSTTVVRDTPPPSTSAAPPPTTFVPPTTTLAPPPTTDAPPPTVVPGPPTINIEMGPIRNRRSTIRWSVDGDASEIAGWTIATRDGDSASVLATLRLARAFRLRVAIPSRTAEFRVTARGAGGAMLARSAWVKPR